MVVVFKENDKKGLVLLHLCVKSIITKNENVVTKKLEIVQNNCQEKL